MCQRWSWSVWINKELEGWSLPTEVCAAVSWHTGTQTAVLASDHPDLFDPLQAEQKPFKNVRC